MGKSCNFYKEISKEDNVQNFLRFLIVSDLSFLDTEQLHYVRFVVKDLREAKLKSIENN